MNYAYFQCNEIGDGIEAVSQQMALVVVYRPVSVAASQQMALVVVSRPVSVAVSQQMALVVVSRPVNVLEVLVQRIHPTSGPSRDSWHMLFSSGNLACDAALFTAACRFQTSDDHQNDLRSLLTTGTSIERSSTVEWLRAGLKSLFDDGWSAESSVAAYRRHAN